MKTDLRTLGPVEAKVVLTLEEERSEAVTVGRIAEIAGLGPAAAAAVASRLARKGWLERITRGRYMLIPAAYGPERTGENNALALASAIYSPSYVGWWRAAAFHGFTTQMPIVIHVALTHQAVPREVVGIEVRFVALAQRKFFGWEGREVYRRRFVVSDREKTVLDCVDRPDLSGGAAEVARIVHAAGSSADPEKMVDYALRFGSVAAAQRLGCLCDLAGVPFEGDARKRLRSFIPRSARTVIGRHERRGGDLGYIPEWGVFVHATESNLLAEVPRRGTTGLGGL